MFDESKIQPYIHDCIVTVYEGKFIYRYRLFFKRHCLLSSNATVKKISHEHVQEFRGDILVMRLSMKNDFYVHLRERDLILANFTVTE